ncbi:hypothetical protein A2348_01895 [Candidatus Uhrbacteria bacterium RIFOXYB12_FULL_58_10]|uniref:Uncharacterized protein n=1 Tax=Candidatus Uhrbacteria bacterium RIFOXYB2_FULL_57_15 TaxID=1802422 RepID=A0A1F7WAD3_9BACT|nr:MAG: hypothetical protein A2348_01895 [Candidatus Uhrbacteria bacterium RIFOXYB12_FULL_58_10]OGL99348.1 MAG: hypothetical protein A2304_00015 [Candidatus Uhrbacteria bacterium RIFOXYB2_FULL_57_15]OGM00479.1 MAG: hypothetical protein A2501_00765 [Candidatus Uhrbacteria bacterium RIFOXYC12_FULL_57_11]
MSRSWKLLDKAFAYGRETSLGNVLRAWIDANGVSTHEAARYLQNNELFGAIQNIDAWLGDEPAGELFTARARKFESLTGIDLEQVIVLEAKREAIRRHPELADSMRFDQGVTRSELVQMAVAWTEKYSGSRHCLTRQIGVPDNRMSPWIRGSFLPSGEELVRLVIGLTRGLIEAACQEDCFLALIARNMFDMTTEDLFVFRSFREMLDTLFAELGDRRAASDKQSVFGLNQPTVDRLRKWDPTKNKLPMETVLTLAHSFLRLHRTDLVDAFDRMRPEFETTWTVTPKTEAIASEPEPEAEHEPELPAVAKQTHARERADEPTEQQNAETAELLELLRSLKKGASHLRAFLDELAPVATGREVAPEPAPVVSSRPMVIGETIDGLEHCLGASGFPDLSGEHPDPNQIKRVREAFAAFRRLLIALGGLKQAARRDLGLKPDLEEAVLLLFGLLKYESPGAAFQIIKSNIDMARNQRARRTR